MKDRTPQLRTFDQVKAHILDQVLREIGYTEYITIWGIESDVTREILRYAEDLAERQASVFVSNQALAPWNNKGKSVQSLPNTFRIRRI